MMHMTVESVSLSGDKAKLIGECEGMPKEVDLPSSEFRSLCEDYPDKTFPFDMFLTHDLETREPFLYMFDISGDR
tara:strand:+ start:116 stop:340 length:225 start_codon:yes stop_codon:yes gene_type:complete